MPAVGATFFPTPVAAGGGFDGIVNFDGGCTGVLLYDGRHVLTAAHCVDSSPQDGVVDNETFTVTFEVPNGDKTFTMTATVAASRITIHPGWTAPPGTENGNDLAIIELDDGFGREEIGTGGRSLGFDLFRATNEVGQTYTLVGYGRSNNSGTNGAELPTGSGLPPGAQGFGTKRQSSNVLEADGARLRNEVQSVEVIATGGTFTLSFGGNPTGNIAFNATPAQVQSALEALANINVGDVQVFGNPGLWYVNFTGAFAATAVGAMGIDGTNLTGATTADVDTEIQGNHYTFNAANVLLYDFDDGTAAHDALGQLYGLNNLGLGATTESIQAAGDSGGPFFLGNRIAGLVSTRRTNLGRGTDGTGSPIDVSDNDSTFGEIGIVTRISSFQAWIDAQLNDTNIDLVLDMSHQNDGNDGSPDTISAAVNGGQFELFVNGVLYYRDNPADISSLRILGSGDGETITLVGSLGLASVTIVGGGGNDTLRLDNSAANAWTINTANGGTVNTNLVTFSGVESLTGGAGIDTFTFQAGGEVARDLDGAGGMDRIDFSALGAQSVTLTGLGGTDGFNGFTLGTTPIGGTFSNINSLTGSSASTADELLNSTALSALWSITAINGGTYQDQASSRPFDFTSFEFLRGGGGDDTFVLNAGTQITGRIDGRGSVGRDVLRGQGVAGNDTMILTPGRLTLDTLPTLFGNIEAVRMLGEQGNDRFTVRFDQGNPVPINGVAVVGGTGFDLLTTIGSALRDGMALTPGFLKVNAAAPISYALLEQMDLFAGGGNDVFDARFINYQAALAGVRFFGQLGNDTITLAPSATTRFFIHGGPPARPTFPGDALFFVKAGQLILPPVILGNGGSDGLYHFKNRMAVQFASIEEGVGGHLDIQPWNFAVPNIF